MEITFFTMSSFYSMLADLTASALLAGTPNTPMLADLTATALLAPRPNTPMLADLAATALLAK